MRNATLAIVILSVAACRGGSSGGGGGGGSGSNMGGVDAGVTPVSIKSVRMSPPNQDTVVAFANVVVTAVVDSKKYGHVYVQDQGGGEYTGIQLFCNYGGTHPDCAMTQAEVEALKPGMVVNVTGKFSSFLSTSAPAGAQPVLEIDAPMIMTTGQMMTPVAVTVDAAKIAKDQQAAATADPYKGTYVKVTGTTFSASSIAAMEFSMTCTDQSMPAQMGTTFGGFEATAGSSTLAVGLSFYKSVTYCLPCSGVAMPYPCTNPLTANETFTSLSGIVEPEYNSNGMIYLQVSPTADTDMPHS